MRPSIMTDALDVVVGRRVCREEGCNAVVPPRCHRCGPCLIRRIEKLSEGGKRA